MTVQFVLFLGIDFGIGLLMMRRAGIWQRLRVAPISRADLVLSRILSATVVSLGTVAAIYGIAIGAFGVRVDGSWAGLVAIIIAFALMNASLGLLIAAVGQNPEAARGLSILVMLILVMVGGAWVPSFVFPEWLQTLSHLTPTYWAIEGLAAMTWRGLPFADAVAPVGAMLAFSALFAAVAMWRFRWAE
jgi:ABC-2 type transport system permease protein